MLIGVPTETVAGERRVALVPEIAGRLIKAGAAVVVQRGAGERAGFLDRAYEDAGATLADDAAAVYAQADAIVKVQKPADWEVDLMREGTTLIAFLSPLGDPHSVERYARKRIRALSMDAIPRISRAQSMDALSSQANAGGYKAVLIAASTLPKFFPMLTTAAGTIPPAKVLIIGAGVAGLQAIATARRLGAVVLGVRHARRRQGTGPQPRRHVPRDRPRRRRRGRGRLRQRAQRRANRQAARVHGTAIGASDCVITTAAVPGRRAPLLVTEEAVQAMRPGSVIVDLAAETGGNCALTVPGEIVERHGVTIVGTTNLPATMPYDASRLYARNIFTLLQHLMKDGALVFDDTTRSRATRR